MDIWGILAIISFIWLCIYPIIGRIKIKKYIKNQKGEMLGIERIGNHDKIYIVRYRIGKNVIQKTVKISFDATITWYDTDESEVK